MNACLCQPLRSQLQCQTLKDLYQIYSVVLNSFTSYYSTHSICSPVSILMVFRVSMRFYSHPSAQCEQWARSHGTNNIPAFQRLWWFLIQSFDSFVKSIIIKKQTVIIKIPMIWCDVNRQYKIGNTSIQQITEMPNSQRAMWLFNRAPKNLSTDLYIHCVLNEQFF